MDEIAHGKLRVRRIVVIIISLLAVAVAIVASQESWRPEAQQADGHTGGSSSAQKLLSTLEVKGRAPKTGYTRAQFGNGWMTVDGCSMREIILHRDLQKALIGDGCKVLSGVLNDPYTGDVIEFKRGSHTSSAVQIDHVVALSNAWQTGAQQLTSAERIELANDPLELLAVDGPANQAKSDGDAATWLPPYKAFRCQYVTRQIMVKAKYRLWVTKAEYDAMTRILLSCPDQKLF